MGDLKDQGLAHYLKGEYDRALDCFNRALDLDPSNHAVRYLRALLLLSLGDFLNGWVDYEYRVLDPRIATRLDFPKWQGESLRNRSILVQCEQGVGDSIMFASCLPDLMEQAGVIYLETKRDDLTELFSRSFPSIIVFTKRAGIVSDFETRIGSLPRYLRPLSADCPGTPYLEADVEKSRKIRARFNKPLIGFSWRGGTLKTRQADRSISLDQFVRILDQRAEWLSLQYDIQEDEVEQLHVLNCTVTRSLSNVDFAAAVIHACDLVISVQNVNLHLAGALGTPAYGLIPFAPEWRYGIAGETMPWYQSLRLIRQNRTQSWEQVLDCVQERLNVFLTHYRLSEVAHAAP